MKHSGFEESVAGDAANVIAAGTKEYYVWQPPGSPLTVSLDFTVIDRLGADVMKGFGAVRRRGTECGGILLGHIDDSAGKVHVTIQDYVPVACEYAFGPSYVLSPTDFANFRRALAEYDPSAEKPLYTVGYYRSHTRDGLSLDDQDIRFFREYFPDPLHVLLLVKPFATKAPVAGFFIQEKGVLKADASYLEFPFRRRDLGGGNVPRPERQERHEPAPPVDSAPVRPKPVETRTPFTASSPNTLFPVVSSPELATTAPIAATRQPWGWKTRVGWLFLCIMLVTFGIVIGSIYSNAPSPRTVASAPDPYALNLSVSRTDDNLLVKWDAQSPAIKRAWKGILTITEGADSKKVELDPANLQNGSVIYRHVPAEVTFRLELSMKEHRNIVEETTWQMKSISPASDRSSE